LRISKRVRIALFVALVPVVYIGAYVELAANGGWYLSQTGKLRYHFGFSVSDVERWGPAWARWELIRNVSGEDTSRGNPQGYFFSPLIRLDRLWVHPDHELLPATQPAG
jgi:hypothetical protein